MPIRILPPEVSVRIAAGEVIERPASVVKELCENAVDAGANEITVEIVQGGRRLIQVADDGCGIPADEVEVAFARHATSKLRSADDLYHVRTLGFRGEALASIASVSRVTLSTRVAGEPVGTTLHLEGGRVLHREAIGRPPGTTLQVENLFFNTPARSKFLRADPTEAGHVARLMSSYALIYPEKRISLLNNGRLALRTLGTGALGDVMVILYGLDVAEQMIPLATSAGQITVNGQISEPSLHRANRRDMLLFVNQRWIQDNALAYAIGEAYRTLLPQGRHPLVVLNITLPPEEVDVNIHPTKQEVRFREHREVFTAVQRAVRTTLMGVRPMPVAQAPGISTAAWLRREGERPGMLTSQQTQLAIELQRPGDIIRTDMPPTVSATRPTDRLPMLRVVGQVAQTYIVAEGPGGLYLIDQHAAHERIRYEALRAQRANQSVATQELLDPLTVEVTPQQAALLEEHLPTLADFGLDMTPFGGGVFLVRRLPAGLSPEDALAAIGEMLDAAWQGGEGFSWEDQALFSLACHSAVRAGRSLSFDEMRDLVRQLECTSLPHTCPHGRPTLIHLSQAQLERQFGRR
jgi:DNA mismatch repair protein MutL